VQPKRSHCRVGLSQRPQVFITRQITVGFKAQAAFAYLQPPSKSPLGFRPNRQRCFDRFAFKKTCPLEFTRHVQPKADNPIDLQFCRAD
jgi:hypothetical protein